MATNTFRFGRLASIVSAAALLSACAGSSIPMGGPSSVAAGNHVAKGAKTFHYNGHEQTFLVPKGVKQISVVMRGAAGGGATQYIGRGGRVHGIIRVRPGEILYVFVGGKGDRAVGGFNGGGDAGPDGTAGSTSFGGGGASDVREGNDHLTDRILVAAGGGGEGRSGNEGGRGGGKFGGLGGSYCYGGSTCIGGGGGNGGAQKHGGLGGAAGKSYHSGQPGASGTFGNGGNGGQGGCYNSGASCECYYTNGCPGAGGGGGYYGGGGGGGGAAEYSSVYESPGGGGGGGSSFASSSVADFRTWAGWKDATADGLVVFSW
ncbi:MAG: glycine rich domain-containing protein [Candidatus Cybelea sp.]